MYLNDVRLRCFGEIVCVFFGWFADSSKFNGILKNVLRLASTVKIRDILHRRSSESDNKLSQILCSNQIRNVLSKMKQTKLKPSFGIHIK